MFRPVQLDANSYYSKFNWLDIFMVTHC